MGRKKRIEKGTHIRIDIKTRNTLKEIGKGETYNDIIRMLVKKAGFYLLKEAPEATVKKYLTVQKEGETEEAEEE